METSILIVVIQESPRFVGTLIGTVLGLPIAAGVLLNQKTTGFLPIASAVVLLTGYAFLK